MSSSQRAADIRLRDLANLHRGRDRIDRLSWLNDGVSGSGKSSLVFGTIAAESQRLIIDLGPGAGHDGGRIVFEGTPADLVKKKAGSLTGRHLSAFVKG